MVEQLGRSTGLHHHHPYSVRHHVVQLPRDPRPLVGNGSGGAGGCGFRPAICSLRLFPLHLDGHAGHPRSGTSTSSNARSAKSSPHSTIQTPRRPSSTPNRRRRHAGLRTRRQRSSRPPTPGPGRPFHGVRLVVLQANSMSSSTAVGVSKGNDRRQTRATAGRQAMSGAVHPPLRRTLSPRRWPPREHSRWQCRNGAPGRVWPPPTIYARRAW